ncbi:hypothetical protein RRU01S_04_01600 [Agrobacterium rubi TR3 = NBRC 13261]|uniref:Uncharacterized protein n=1 Tax=Agrobacterium rubi TR3 = NBRC 13261 TaxID=1368415 RepID=A0A081CRP2_9HYPH|nr:hypothetical protein [Agrobacterium rubi]MBP1876853.1 hypothetical protein [Agrobacterium rubi]MCL6651046.1 hypothetical protein [Agrobacterium rubi]GAK69338.1 hypothetical protein RRU01S_04_01600 [Agrobacterium rubi TR3 = NBRC 13261]
MTCSFVEPHPIKCDRTPSESDNAVAKEIFNLVHSHHVEGGVFTSWPTHAVEVILARHRQPVAPSRTAEEVVRELFGVPPEMPWPFPHHERAVNLIQSALDAARVEGARLALEAAAKEAEQEDEYGHGVAREIRALDPAAIVKGGA